MMVLLAEIMYHKNIYLHIVMIKNAYLTFNENIFMLQVISAVVEFAKL